MSKKILILSILVSVMIFGTVFAYGYSATPEEQPITFDTQVELLRMLMSRNLEDSSDFIPFDVSDSYGDMPNVILLNIPA